LPCPRGVMDSFMARLHGELDASAAAGHATHRTCRGTLMSREQYLIDTQERGYFDGRQVPRGTMSTEEIEAWTDAIRRGRSPEGARRIGGPATPALARTRPVRGPGP